MKNARGLFVIVSVIACAVAALNVEAGSARGPRVDPNAVDKVPSPFRGSVVVSTATTLTVKGDVKTKSRQPANGEPRPEAGQQPKETSVARTASFFVKPDTKVTKDGKAAQLKDLHPGDMVQVTFSVKEGTSLRHVSEVAISSVGFSDPTDQAKGDKKKAKQ